MQNKVVIITGASSGIGKALVYEFAKRGAKIAMGARNLDELQKIETDLKSRGVDALSVQTDVTRELDCKNLVEKTVERFGKIDVLVNNAGRTHFVQHSDLDGMKSEYFDDIFALNVKGTFFMCRAAADALKKSHGVIINITSIAGVTGLGSSIAYAASKAAEISITKSLARVLAPEVRVIGVAPGIVLTRWVEGHADHIYKLAGETPLQKVAEPADIAQTVYALIAHADFVTGQNLIVDGGAFI